MYSKLIDSIKASIKLAEDEKPPMKPFDKILKKAPPKFPYDQYTLIPPDDARKVGSRLEALKDRSEKIQALEREYKQLRVQTEEKISGMKDEVGFSNIEQEMQEFKTALVPEVEEVLDRVGDSLIEHNNTLITILTATKAGTATSVEVKSKLIEVITKYVGKNVLGKIIADADAAIAAVEDAKSKTTRRVVAWPSPQDLRKLIKQELPKGAEASVKQADVMTTLKGWLNSAISFLKSAWGGVADKLADLSSSLQQAEPERQEVEALLQEAVGGVVESNKVQSTFGDGAREWATELEEPLSASLGHILEAKKSLKAFKEVLDDPQNVPEISEVFADTSSKYVGVVDEAISDLDTNQSAISSMLTNMRS